MNHEKQPIKPKYKDVTAAEVKACKGYESISDELAHKIADAFRVYTEIIYNCFREGKFEEQKAKVISLNNKENKKAA